MKAVRPDRSSWAPAPVATNVLRRKCACGSHSMGGECDACRKKAESHAHWSNASGSDEAPGIVHDVLRAPGVSLDRATRDYFEPRFGHDFSNVRVHADERAQASARAVDASAYTVGSHVVFGRGAYTPHTALGRDLLAHELAHVVQQGQSHAAASSALRIGDASSGAEFEADRMAHDVVSDPALQRVAAVQTSLARSKAPDAPKCPATHTMADDVYKALGEAWAKSGHGGSTVAEHGGRIVTDKAGKRVIRTGGGGSGSISLPPEKTGDVTLGTFHTHPYSKSEGSNLGVGFSGGDITHFVAGGQGNVKYVGAGSCNFMLDTLDATARDGCKKVDIDKRWDDAFKGATGDFPAKVETAVKAAIAGCGLCYYKACRPDEKSAIPKTGNLV
jgi:hypothetical protein